ncbi:MAG: Ig-like domain-containing protein [Bacteroidota bacterium]
MKFNKILLGVAICTTGLITSCKKDDSGVQVSTSETNSTVQASGVAADDEKIAASVPMLMSTDFLQRVSEESVASNNPTRLAKGKPTTGDRTLPTVLITSPSTGSIVSGTVGITVSASDNVGVSSVKISVDGTVLATKSAAPYTFSWNALTAIAGTHTISATAQDAAGNISSTSIQVGINALPTGDLTAPLVSITSPANGSSFTIGATTTVGVAASDNIGVTSVSFSVDGVVKSTLAAAPYNFSWNTTGVASGAHTLTATAKDAAGNTKTSSISVALNTVIVNPPTLPTSYRLNTPPAITQGSESSCVAFSAVYIARSIEQYYKTNATSYSQATNIFSPEFAYNLAKVGADCGSGTNYTNLLELMKNQGVPTWQSMPYSSTNGCTLMPTSTQYADAANYKISSYISIANTDQTAIKSRIVSNHPVMVYCTIDQAFYDLMPGMIWNTKVSTYGFPHSLAIVGYDDSKKAYLAMNSWGTGWGDAGFCWVDYNFFPTVTSYLTYSIN